MGLFDKIFGKKDIEESSNQSPPKVPLGTTTELLDEDQFWKLIQRTISSSDGSYERQQAELKQALLELDAHSILKFDNRFRKHRGDAYNWNLWGVAYIMNGGCSDDCFSDFRGWLIGQGKELYYKALSNSESVVELSYEEGVDDWEGLSYVAMEAYQEKQGSRMPIGFQENFEISGESWEEEGDDLENRFPRVWKKWW